MKIEELLGFTPAWRSRSASVDPSVRTIVSVPIPGRSRVTPSHFPLTCSVPIECLRSERRSTIVSLFHSTVPDGSILRRFLANLPIRPPRQVVGLSGLIVFRRANGTLFLRPALIDALQAPFGRFPGSANRLVAHDRSRLIQHLSTTASQERRFGSECAFPALLTVADRALPGRLLGPGPGLLDRGSEGLFLPNSSSRSMVRTREMRRTMCHAPVSRFRRWP